MSASTWEDFKQSANALAQKIGKRTEELTDIAALHMKISARQSDLEDAYLVLGKRVYAELYAPSSKKADVSGDAVPDSDTPNDTSSKTEPTQDETAGSIRDAADRVTALVDEIEQLKQTLEEKKQKSNP